MDKAKEIGPKDINKYGYANKDWKKMTYTERFKIEMAHEDRRDKPTNKGLGEYLKLKGDPRADEVIKALDPDGVPLKHCTITRNIKRKRK